MKTLNNYIFEKLKLDKNIKDDEGYDKEIVENILYFCELDNDSIYTDKIIEWVKDNKVKNFYPYADCNLLKYLKINPNIIRDFIDNSEIVKDKCTDLIVSGNGEEFNGPKWKDPKLYYKDDTLIFHQYIDDKSISKKPINVDRVFIKTK